MRAQVEILALFLAASVMHAEEFQNPSHAPRMFGASGPTLSYLVLGDSTAAGQGADYEQGIAVSTARALAVDRKVTMVNLAISGARTSDVVQNQLSEAEQLHASLVLISIGANDVVHLTGLESVRRGLDTIVTHLRSSNPTVAIVVTGSPDMGAPPRIPWLLRPIAAWRTRQINAVFERVAREDHVTFARIAETTGPLFRNDRSLFFSDRFHPNERGYATWLPELNRALAQALTH